MSESGVKRPANPLQRASDEEDHTDAASVLIKGNSDDDDPGCPTYASNAAEPHDIVQEAPLHCDMRHIVVHAGLR